MSGEVLRRIMNELVSVIVPVYNNEKSLEKCLESIRTQIFQHIEIIVIDDGSTDMSPNIIRHFQSMDNRIKAFSQAHLGVSAARNLGLNKSSGEYCCFVDADDYVSNMYVQALYDGITANDSDMATVANYYENRNGRWSTKTRGDSCILNKEEALINFLSRNGMKGGPVSKMFRKVILDRFNVSFDTRFRIAEDKLFDFEYILQCNKVSFSSKPEYYYTFSSDSASNKKRCIKELGNAYLPFGVLYEMRKLLPKDSIIEKAFNAFEIQVIARVTWKYRLSNSLSDHEYNTLRQILISDIKKCDMGMLLKNIKCMIYSMLLIAPLPRKLFR